MKWHYWWDDTALSVSHPLIEGLVRGCVQNRWYIGIRCLECIRELESFKSYQCYYWGSRSISGLFHQGVKDISIKLTSIRATALLSQPSRFRPFPLPVCIMSCAGRYSESSQVLKYIKWHSIWIINDILKVKSFFEIMFVIACICFFVPTIGWSATVNDIPDIEPIFWDNGSWNMISRVILDIEPIFWDGNGFNLLCLLQMSTTWVGFKVEVQRTSGGEKSPFSPQLPLLN